MAHRRHAVLAPVSQGYPPPNDKSLRVTHPSATDTEMPVRLACVKHAASVRSEPGSNSQVHHSPEPKSQTTTNEDPTQLTRSSSRQIQPTQKSIIQRKAIIPETDQRHRSHDNNQSPLRIRRQHPLFELRQSSQVTFITSPINTKPKPAPPLSQKHPKAPPTYPFHSRCKCQRAATGHLVFVVLGA